MSVVNANYVYVRVLYVLKASPDIVYTFHELNKVASTPHMLTMQEAEAMVSHMLNARTDILRAWVDINAASGGL